MQNFTTPKLKEKSPFFPSVVAGVYFIGEGCSIHVKRFIRPFQPLAEKTPDGNKLRRQNFALCEGEGSGYNMYCDYSHVENFVSAKLKLEYGRDKGMALFHMFRPSYICAFEAVKIISKSSNTSSNDQYVTFNEFRVLNAYLCIFGAMLDAFATLNEGSGVDTLEDLAMDKETWLSEYATVHEHGFSGLTSVINKSLATIAFDQMDRDTTGAVGFEEFSEYIKNTEQNSMTDLGKLLSGEVPRIAPKASPNKLNTRRSASVSIQLNQPFSNNARPLSIASAFHPGTSCTQELMDFLRVFQPFAEKTLTGKKDRQKNFEYADPDGNGYASFVEIDSFIKHALDTGHSRTRSKELYTRFKKCYKPAYLAAKHGEEYVTFNEFRLLNAYLCIYGSILDAFLRMDADGDSRVELSEFKRKYSHMRDYGLMALSSLENPDDAADGFHQMNKDGHGLLFPEWCSFILKAEIQNDTELGKLMSLGSVSEAGSFE